MNRNYQQEYDLYSEEIRQQREYRELYDPFKSNWEDAVGNTGIRKRGFPGAHEDYSPSTYRKRYGNYSRETSSSKDKERSGTGYSPYDSDHGRQFGNRTDRAYSETPGLKFQNADLEDGSKYGATWNQQGASETGGVPRRNTYGYYTTGYGPRD